MKATEFEEMVKNMLEVTERYLPVDQEHTLETIDRIYELLWDNFEQLIAEDDRNYN